MSDYLHFSRKDRIGSIVLVICIIVIFLLPHFLPGKEIVPIAVKDSVRIASIGESKENNREDVPIRMGTFTNVTKHSLFYFDPNTLSLEDWRRLGLREKTISTILNYRSKGGRFRSADDLQKIYGLRPEEFSKLRPYVRIEKSEPAKTISERSFVVALPHPSPSPRYSPIDINLADTSAWIALPGIGSKLATRIVNFRDKLGGFHSIEQVGETFGLPDSTFQKIRYLLKLGTTEVTRININKASPDELKKHPYIRWQLASAIISYRNEHGLFKQLEDLKNIMAITEELFRKISPYLTVN